MVKSPLLWISACLIGIQFAGCATMESRHSSIGKSAHSVNSTSKAQENVDGDAEEADEEVDDTRKNISDESRAGLARDEALDPWFGKYDYADKGRAIERNLR